MNSLSPQGPVRGTSFNSSATGLIYWLDGHYKGLCGIMLVIQDMREVNWQGNKWLIFEERLHILIL